MDQLCFANFENIVLLKKPEVSSAGETYMCKHSYSSIQRTFTDLFEMRSINFQRSGFLNLTKVETSKLSK